MTTRFEAYGVDGAIHFRLAQQCGDLFVRIMAFVATRLVRTAQDCEGPEQPQRSIHSTYQFC
jgi:hypothetical protein